MLEIYGCPIATPTSYLHHSLALAHAPALIFPFFHTLVSRNKNLVQVQVQEEDED